MLAAQAQQQALGRSARIFPGHGEFYRVDEAEAMLKELAGGKGAHIATHSL